MKKLLQINSVVNKGSTGGIVEDIGQLAIENGWESYIAYGRNNQSSKSNLLKIGSTFNAWEHALETRLFDNHGLASRRATEIFTGQIKEIDPDIIHLHNIHGYYVNVEKLFNYLDEFNKPVVWTLHDCWSFTGHCAYFSYVQCEKWKTQCHNCPQTHTYPASYLLDRSRSNYKKKDKIFNSIDNLHLIPVSKWLNELLGDSFLKHHDRQVIYNGINIDAFQPIRKKEMTRKLGIENKFVILGVASVWEERKGLQDFKKISKFIDEDQVIVTVGVTDDQMKELPENIIGINRTDNIKELVELYSTADVFVNPTYEDNYPTTNLEAIACGTPVITYNTGGSVESITKDTGIIVEKGNIDGLLSAIRNIKKKQGSERNEIRSDCRNYALNHFDKNERYQEYFLLYRQLI